MKSLWLDGSAFSFNAKLVFAFEFSAKRLVLGKPIDLKSEFLQSNLLAIITQAEALAIFLLTLVAISLFGGHVHPRVRPRTPLLGSVRIIT